MKNSRVEIYGTFGPACKSGEILEEMIRRGMTGMRLNLSHTTLDKSREYLENYKEAAQSCGVIPQILMDMQGPELRIGEMEEVKAESGGYLYFVKDSQSAKERLTEAVSKGYEEDEVMIPVPAAVMNVLETGQEVLLDDGKIHVQIEKVREDSVKAHVFTGGTIKPHKSIKIIGKNVTMPILTSHDIENIRRARKYGVTALMQPFVFSGEDLKRVREILAKEKMEHLRIFAKIENREGVDNLENIIPEADMVVIARGDLGNDMPLWELPAVQKRIEETCKKFGKPYLVVTQMLASMEENPVPTRAEVSDIFHAVYHGAAAVMVTGETAVGKYPVKTIEYLANTSLEAEKFLT